MKSIISWQSGWGQRILNSRFIGITTFIRDNDQSPLFWCYKTRRWVTSLVDATEGASTHAPCRSFKAFERHLKKHVAELEGYEVYLVHRFKGHDVTAQVWK
jgi:hypothetical protein